MGLDKVKAIVSNQSLGLDIKLKYTMDGLYKTL